jgi:teichuronic acid biosynthesis glycosyltransferase TuaH
MKGNVRVNIFATTFEGSLFKVGAHHIYKVLKNKQINGTYASSPNSVFNLFRFRQVDVRRRNVQAIRSLFDRPSKNTSYVPMNLLPYSVLRKFLQKEVAIKLSRPFRFIKFDISADLSIIDSVDLLFLVPCLMQHKQTIIYRPTDIYSYKSEFNLELEKEYIRKNKIKVFCMSAHSYQFYLENDFNVVGYMENGINEEWIKDYQGYNSLEQLNLVYVGSLDDRIDYDIIKRIAGDEDLSLTVYGAGPRVRNINEIGKKLYRGTLCYSDLARVLRSYNVGVLPLNENLLNLSRSPMKFYEYLAAGLYVLNSSQLNELLLISGVEEKRNYIRNISQSQENVFNELRLRSWEAITAKLIDCALNEVKK